MKKTTLFSGALLIIASFTHAQNSTYLDIGNVRALIHSDGNLFQDRNNGQAAFEVPKGSNAHSIFASSFWLGSESIRNGQKHIASSAETYGISQASSFVTGPVDIVNQTNDSSAAFQRLWKVDKADIDQHIQNWNNPGYVVPAPIADWPGNGNANTAQNLAPYADLDGDNNYEPQDGEYPIIRGDQAVYLILNDFHRHDIVIEQLQAPPAPPIFRYNWGSLNVEMHVMLYAFDSQNPAISNAVFSNVKIYNRSTDPAKSHSDFHFSVFTDFDLGGANDDFIATDTSHNLFYTYNGSLVDNGQGGQAGYGNQLAAQGVQFLDHPIGHSIYYNSGNSPNGDPTLPENYLNYQKGIWKNGQPYYYGGDAFNFCTDTTQTTKFVFTGNPAMISDTTQWTESNPCLSSTSTPNAAGDRRLLGGPRVPKQLNIGESIEINYAYIFARDRDSSTYIGEPADQLFLVADSVQNFFDQNIVTSIRPLAVQEVHFEIFPNPSNERVQLNISEKQFELSVFDVSGSLIEEGKNMQSLDVSDYPKGVYFLQVRTAHKVGTKKLIVTD